MLPSELVAIIFQHLSLKDVLMATQVSVVQSEFFFLVKISISDETRCVNASLKLGTRRQCNLKFNFHMCEFWTAGRPTFFGLHWLFLALKLRAIQNNNCEAAVKLSVAVLYGDGSNHNIHFDLIRSCYGRDSCGGAFDSSWANQSLWSHQTTLVLDAYQTAMAKPNVLEGCYIQWVAETCRGGRKNVLHVF